MISLAKWHTYLLQMRWEAKDRWYDSMSQPDNLPCFVEVICLEVLTAEQGPLGCHKTFPFHCQFPLPF